MLGNKICLVRTLLSTGFQRALCTDSSRIEKTVNTVTLLGRVGADPQRRGNDEHPVVMFSVATHSNYKYESGDWMQKTDWHRVVVFKPGLRDSVLSYLKKGQRTLVTGKITYGEITDQEGKQRTTSSIIADDVIFLQH
ncbi:single-stranded DNA-binding protein, mitochondrial [Anopheles cruzii]|uniref:single-stranded DNA-binding protein, mitochondrial n=1 Tax=Anopheles cruzii TaxID=68878 RepID=UPI0022EC2F4B|nr:single-stranded DNA-binding protein, mitochondrial [Anopheles cruzii]